MTDKRAIDETGSRHGRLVVLAGHEKVGGGARWSCICDCGRETMVRGAALRAGQSQSCGICVRKGLNALPGDEAAFRVVYSRYKYRAKRKGIPFELDVEEFKRLTSGSCHYCGSMPSRAGMRSGRKVYTDPYIYNGVDRVDSAKGYVAGNMVPCCTICNTAKMDRPLGEFLDWISRLKKMNQVA